MNICKSCHKEIALGKVFCDKCGEPSFRDELTRLINRYSRENGSDTPDFVLAQFLCVCLLSFDQGVRERERWYGRTAGDGSAILGKPVTKEGP